MIGGNSILWNKAAPSLRSSMISEKYRILHSMFVSFAELIGKLGSRNEQYPIRITLLRSC